MPRWGVGNPNNKGGGRKSAYIERQDAIWHEDVWKNAQDIDALVNKIRSRKYAGRDIAALKLLQGDKHLIGKFLDKLVPNKIDITSDGEKLPQPILGFIKTNADDNVSSDDDTAKDSKPV